jgi:glycosyltransferase involved in cell wall biosynthesis
MRILYSFPHKLGADRICYTAWQQVCGLAHAGVEVTAMCGVFSQAVPESVECRPTLSRGKLRIPYRLLGRMNSCRLHDFIVARRLENLADEIDLVHCWPLGSLQTLKTAQRLGIPAVLERPNAHTRFCYETVEAECRRIAIGTPHHDYDRDEQVLQREEEEFQAAFALLCASAFAEASFLERGFDSSRILRHTYGFDESKFFPSQIKRGGEFTALFAGVDAVRKGLHLALNAWLASSARETGKFLIAGELSPEFQRRFADELRHPSIVALGHRRDVPEFMRNADILFLPSLEEGFGLVCAEAIGSGCVPVVSGACTDICRHLQNALVHPVGDVETLTRHITMLHEDRALLQRLRENCIRERLDYTWTGAGRKLREVYETAIERHAAKIMNPNRSDAALATITATD